MDQKNGLLLALSSITTSILISAAFHAPWAQPRLYSDIVDSFFTRPWVQAGAFPYTTDWFEYPAISGLLTYLVRQTSADINGYYDAFVGFSLLAGVLIAWASHGIAKKAGRDINPLYFMMPSFLLYGLYNFDLFNGMFIILALFAFVKKKYGFSAVLLGLAVDTKLVALVVFPVLLFEVKGTRERLKLTALFAITIALFNVPFALYNYSYFIGGYQYISSYGLENAWYIWIFQDQSTWSLAKLFGLGVSALLLLRIYTLKMGVLPKSFLAITAYLLGTYIYAPQFNLALLPLVAAMDLKDPALYPWEGFNALIIITWFNGCCDANWHPTLVGSIPQLLALFRAGALALMFVNVASSEGHSVVGWVRKMMGMESGRSMTLEQSMQTPS